MSPQVRASDRDAVLRGSRTRWRSVRDSGVHGTRMEALARRGLAEVRVVNRPYRHFQFRLTGAGEVLRLALSPPEPPVLRLALSPPEPPEVPTVTVRCPFCGWEDSGRYVVGARCGACYTGFVELAGGVARPGGPEGGTRA